MASLGTKILGYLATSTQIANGIIGRNALASGFANSVLSITAGTTNLTLSNVGTIFVNAAAGNVIINLPAATVGSGLGPAVYYSILRTDTVFTNTVTIIPNGADTVSGSAVVQLYTQFSAVELISDNVSSWRSPTGNLTQQGRKNLIINGNFDVWQRGTTMSASGYTSDRWLLALGTSGVGSVSRQAFTPGDLVNEPQYFSRWTQSTGGTGTVSLEQRVEGVRTAAGKTVTLSFYAKAASTLTIGSILATQVFGTGGSPSSNVPTTVASAVTLTTSWQKFSFTFTVPSIAGKTLGTNGDDYLQILFSMPTSSIFTFDLAQIQLELGSIASAFEYRSFGDISRDCERYYQKSYPYASAPGTVTMSGTHGQSMPAYGTPDGIFATINYRTRMRLGTPTIVLVDPNSGTTGNWYNINSGSAIAVSSQAISDTGFQVYTAVTTSQGIICGHYTASNEL